MKDNGTHFVFSGPTQVFDLSDQTKPPIGHTLRINEYVLRFDGEIYQDVTHEADSSPANPEI